MLFVKGMRDKIGNYFDEKNKIEVIMEIDGGTIYEFFCFGVNLENKLFDDKYMIYHGQMQSPNNEIVYVTESQKVKFNIDLEALPIAIQKLIFTVSIDGNGVMSEIITHKVTLFQKDSESVIMNFKGNDFLAEKTIISVEIYKKDVWRVASVANGFDGGLSELLAFLGRKEESAIEEKSTVLIRSMKNLGKIQTNNDKKICKRTNGIMKVEEEKMERICIGNTASRGVAIGRVYLYNSSDFEHDNVTITKEQIQSECDKLSIAEEAVLAEQNQLDEELISLLCLEMYDKIRDEMKDAQQVVCEYIEESMADTSDDRYIECLKDLGVRILTEIKGKRNLELSESAEPVIVVAREIFVVNMIEDMIPLVKGIIIEEGDITSPSYITALKWNIPILVGIKDILSKVDNGDTICMDASEGVLIVKPDEDVVKNFMEMIKDDKKITLNMEKENKENAKDDLLENNVRGKNRKTYCTNCGQELPENAKFCNNCGFKVISDTTSPDGKFREHKQSGMLRKDFVIAKKYHVVFDEELCQYIEIRAPFEKNAYIVTNKLMSYIKESVLSFDDLYDIAWNAFLRYFNSQLEIGFNMLFKYDFDLYSIEMFKQNVWEYLENNESGKYIQKYYQIQKEIEKFVEQLEMQKKSERNNRSYWSGGGFGIKGALTGSIKAGLLNMGTEIVRGIGDSLTDSGDKRKIAEYKEKTYKEGKGSNYLTNALYFAVCDIGVYVYSVLVDAKILRPVDLVSEKTMEAKAANIYDHYKYGQYTKEETIAKLCSCIQMCPYHVHPERNIYKIEPESKDGLYELGDYLGVREAVNSWIKKIDRGEF